MMFGFIKAIFGGQEVDSEMERELTQAARDGLDIEAALMAHENWKLRLQNYLDGRSSEDLRSENICFDDRCDLGQWIHGPGAKRLGRFPGFTALQNNHRMFHYAASNVVALAQAGKKDQAQRMLKTQYEEYSHNVCSELITLRQLVEKHRAR